MIRYYCDFCDAEITDANKAVGGAITCPETRLGTTLVRRNRLLHVDRELKVEILTSMDGVANAGHACRYCIIDALNRLDDRVKPA